MWQATIWEPARGQALADRQTTTASEQAQLARLRRQVDTRWRTLALAGAGAAQSSEALERLYDAYLRAVDAYVARQRALSHPREQRQRAS